MKYISVVACGLFVTSYIPMTQAHEGSSTLASALIKDQSAGQSTKQTSAIKYAHGNVVKEGEVYRPAWQRNQSTIEQVLSYTYDCAPNLTLRFQSLTEQNIKDSCALLLDTQTRFQQLFNRQGKPVAHDNNRVLRANIYASRDDYQTYVTPHFDVPSNNGGMYLEGLPHLPENRAEYVAFLRDGKVWNLNHEFVHYLDGRFNLYGDYCMGLHDNHAGPEYCLKPAPKPPYLTWWTEGIAEYVAHMENNPKAVALAKHKTYLLSELLYNSGEGWNTDKVYRWGYLAARYMMEEQREKVEEMLFFTRQGDFPRYQALVLSWGTSMDEAFNQWLETL